MFFSELSCSSAWFTFVGDDFDRRLAGERERGLSLFFWRGKIGKGRRDQERKGDWRKKKGREQQKKLTW